MCAYQWVPKPFQWPLRLQILVWLIICLACLILSGVSILIIALVLANVVIVCFMQRSMSSAVNQLCFRAPYWYIFNQKRGWSRALSLASGGLRCSFFIQIKFKAGDMHHRSWFQRLRWLCWRDSICIFRSQLSEGDWCLLCQMIFSQGK